MSIVSTFLATPVMDAAPVKSRVWSRSALISAICAVLAMGVLAEMAWLWNGAVVPWDSKNHFYPMFRFLANELANGEWPFWNPYHFAGHPSAADPQSLVFSPTMVLLALIAPQASMQQFDAWIMAHLAFGGLGILAIFHQRNWAATGAVLAAMIFMLGGSATGRLQHTGMILSYSFFPWALFTLEMALQKRSYLFGLLFGITAALMAQGRDQVAFLFCLWLIVALVWDIAHAQMPLRYLRQRLGLILFMGLVGALLLGGPMLLTLQFLAQSNRPAIAYGVAAEGSLSPINLVTLAIPNFFGSLDWNYDYWGPGYETIPRGDWTDRAINYLFIGTLPSLILVWDGLLGRQIFNKSLRKFAWILLFTFFYAVGRGSPVFEWIFDHIPGVALYRRPADATFALNVGLAMVSGYLTNNIAAHGLPKLTGRTSRAIWLGAASGLLAATLASALYFSYQQNHLGGSLAALGTSLGILVVAIALLVWAQQNHKLPQVMVLFVALSGLNLLERNAANSLDSEPIQSYAPYATLPPSQQAGLDLLDRDIAAHHELGNYPRVEILGLSGAWMNASMVFGLENTIGYNPLRIADYERAVGPGDNSADITLRRYPENFRGYSSTLAKLLGLEYLVLGAPLPKLPRHVPRPIATLLYGTEGMYIYKLRPPQPRAYFVTQIKSVDSQAVTEGDALPDFDRSREALLDEDSIAKLKNAYPPGDAATSINAKVGIKAMHANSVLLETDTEQPGVLVLHDIYYPGWQVSIDGTPATLLRANILFRGVEVPAGHHLVHFKYAPFSAENLREAIDAVLHR